MSNDHEISEAVEIPMELAHPESVPLPTDSQTSTQLEVELASGKTRSKMRMLAILIALYLSLFVAALDQTIVATSVPTISNQLHSSSGFVWIGGAYLLANAVAAPIWTKLSDIWGRKHMLLLALAWFFASSIACAAAKTMNAFIIGRAFQGTAGGGLINLVNVILSDLFSMRSRSLYLGLLETMWAIAAGIGPILGGAFSEFASWRWNFWVNLPFIGISFILILIYLDVHNPRTGVIDGIKAIDWFGTLSFLGLVLMLLLGLQFGGDLYPWNSAKVICLIVVGAFMTVFLVLSEKKFAKYPLIPPSIFSNKSNVASLLVTFFHGAIFIGAEYYLPIYFQSVKQAGPFRSGVLILPFIVCEALAGITAGIFIHQTGGYLEPIYAGLILITIGNGLFILFGTSTSLGEIIVFELIAGLGAGGLFSPPLIALQSFVPKDDVATATGMLGFIRNLATSMSIVIAGVLFKNGMDLRHDTLEMAGLSLTLLEAFSGPNAEANVMLIGQISNKTQEIAVKDAFSWSLRHLWIMYTGIAGIALFTSFFIGKAVLSTEHVETKTGLKKISKEPEA